jgi:hypothetical protein
MHTHEIDQRGPAPTALMPIVEAQARFIGDCLVGNYVFPPASQMAAGTERERERLSRRFVRSERHAMEIDFDRYLRELQRDRRRGRIRAHSASNSLPGGRPPTECSKRQRPLRRQLALRLNRLAPLHTPAPDPASLGSRRASAR